MNPATWTPAETLTHTLAGAAVLALVTIVPLAWLALRQRRR